MADIAPKKLLILNIYEILKRYTDDDHTLTQKQIIDILRRDYYMEVERKAVKRNLEMLAEKDANVVPDRGKFKRIGRNGEEEELCRGWYYHQPFCNAELHFIIDSLVFGKNIPAKFLKGITDKVSGLTSKYFKHNVPNSSAVKSKYQNGDYFWNVENIYKGIEKGQQISFIYNTYFVDKKNKIQRQPITDESGEPKRFIVDPYRMAMTNGRYFLIGREKDSALIDNFQIDRITDIELLDTGFERVEDIEKSFDLSEYVSQHIYMFSGSIDRVIFKANNIILGDVVDWFGNDLTVMKSDGESFTASVKVNYKAMKYWAIQYLKYVTVLSPKGLVDDIKSTISGALENYNKEDL